MRFKKIRLLDFKNELSAISKYSLLVLISVIISNLDSNLDKTLLGIFVDSSSVAMYQLSISFASHLLVLSYAFSEVMRPTVYELYRNNKLEEANDLFISTSRIQLLVVLFVVGGYISCGYHFTMAWIGKKRIDVFFYSVVLFVSNIIPLTRTMSGEAYRANNMHRFVVLFHSISILINVVLSITLLFSLDRSYSIWACIIGTVVPRIIISCIIVPIFDYKKIGLPIKQYFTSFLMFLSFAFVAIIPALILFTFMNDLSVNILLKVFAEGLMFVIIYLIEIVLFGRKTLQTMINQVFKRKKDSGAKIS